jgi:hypothetical protein
VWFSLLWRRRNGLEKENEGREYIGTLDVWWRSLKLAVVRFDTRLITLFGAVNCCSSPASYISSVTSSVADTGKSISSTCTIYNNVSM